jgi:hypothetical protein
VESFAARNFGSGEMLAVHVRGSDKAIELLKGSSYLAEGHQWIFGQVKAQLAAKPGQSVFLMTDDFLILQYYLSAFPGRVISTDCIRSSTDQGVHYLPAPSRGQLGIELLRDMYLAARCDRLLALGSTNVSNFILHLKQWPEGAAEFFGPFLHYSWNLLPHA